MPRDNSKRQSRFTSGPWPSMKRDLVPRKWLLRPLSTTSAPCTWLGENSRWPNPFIDETWLSRKNALAPRALRFWEVFRSSRNSCGGWGGRRRQRSSKLVGMRFKRQRWARGPLRITSDTRRQLKSRRRPGFDHRADGREREQCGELYVRLLWKPDGIHRNGHKSLPLYSPGIRHRNGDLLLPRALLPPGHRPVRQRGSERSRNLVRRLEPPRLR